MAYDPTRSFRSIQAFDFTIKHRKDSANVVPDALSRVYVDEVRLEDEPIDLNHQAFVSPEYSALKSRILNNQARLLDLKVRGRHVFVRTQTRKDISVAEGTYWKLWVPTELIEKLTANAHNPPLAAHSGVGKTLEKLRRLFYWQKMAAKVIDVIKLCQVCKESKAPYLTLCPPMGNQVTGNDYI